MPLYLPRGMAPLWSLKLLNSWCETAEHQEHGYYYGILYVHVQSSMSPTEVMLQGDVDVNLYKRGAHLMQQINDDIDPNECWTQIRHVAQKLLPPALHPTFLLHMSTRHFSARVEAFQNMYMQQESPSTNFSSCAVASLHGETFSNAGRLKEALLRFARNQHKHASKLTPPSPIDHVMHGPHRPECHVVLYAAPMTSGFGAMDTAITGAIDAGAKCSYALRPVLLDRCAVAPPGCLRLGRASSPSLAGYGVELFIKDTEYNQVCDGQYSSMRCSLSTFPGNACHAIAPSRAVATMAVHL